MTPSEQHPALERLQQYCAGELPDFEEMALEDHFTHCDACMAAVRRMDALLFRGFTAEAHATALEMEARLADPLATALRLALRTHHEFAASLRAWLDGAAGLWSGAAVRRWGEGALLPARGSATETLRVGLNPGEFRCEIDVRESGQTIEVEQPGAVGSIALLFQSGEAESVRVVPFQALGEVHLAVFEDVPEGHYCLAVAPR